MHFLNTYSQEVINEKKISLKNIIQYSFEFFPPKNINLEQQLYHFAQRFSKLKPCFFSVTYGANNGEYKKTYAVVKKIREMTKVITVPHLTCVNKTSFELEKIAQLYWENGIRNIVALRGDAKDKIYQHNMYAVDLIILLKKVADFDISVATYPEMHPESKDIKDEILNLKKKIDVGANRAITQFFFNVDSYLRFRDQCTKNNIYIEIIPGILPIYNFQQLKKFASMTNVNIPDWMFKVFNGLDNDLSMQKIIGSNILLNIVNHLSREGVNNFHFYTLNQLDVVYSICHMLNNAYNFSSKIA